MPRDWLKKQPITGHYQHICCTTTCACILQTNRPLFPFDTNDVTQNLDCWQSSLRVSNCMWCTTYEDGHPMRVSAYVGTQSSPSSNLWICMDQPPKLHETERTLTKTNGMVKSAKNTSSCNSSSFLLCFISFTKYKPSFFQPNCCLVPFLSSCLVLQ